MIKRCLLLAAVLSLSWGAHAHDEGAQDLSAPTNISAEVSGTSVQVSFTALSNVDFVDVYRNGLSIGSVGASAGFYLDVGAPSGTHNYSFTGCTNDGRCSAHQSVSATVTVGSSGGGGGVVTTPVQCNVPDTSFQVSGVTLVPNGDGTATVSWSPITGASGYNVDNNLVYQTSVEGALSYVVSPYTVGDRIRVSAYVRDETAVGGAVYGPWSNDATIGTVVVDPIVTGCDQVQLDLDVALTRIEGLTAETERQQGIITELDAEQVELLETIASLQATTTDERVRLLSDQVVSLSAQVSILESTVNAREAERDEAQGFLDTANMTIEERDATITTLTTERDAAVTAQDIAIARVLALEDIIEAIQVAAVADDVTLAGLQALIATLVPDEEAAAQ